MLIVADSSALIALAICHSLYLLDTLFAEIKVPPAVFQEVTEPDKPVANVLKNYLMDKVSPIVSTSILIETGRLDRPVVTLVIYGDESKKWRPEEYQRL